MTVATILGEYGAALRTQRLDDELVHHAKRAVVDWFAALMPGAVESPPRLLERSHADDLDRGPARLALGRAATVRTAALINGTAAHTVEVDDIFREAIYHPGAPTIAAALALAQSRQASGLDFLKAVVTGYEISTRIGAALGRAHYKYWHNTGTVGAFGAAAASASLLELEALPFAHALATAATFAAGLQQAFRMDSMSKPLHSGHAAQVGVMAAQMAACGVTGSLDVIDGEAGLGRAMSTGPDWVQALATLGREHHITHMTFKNHACCGHTFAPIDGALALKSAQGWDVAQMQSIRVATYAPALDVAGNMHPRTAAEARFSIAYVVANALLYGSVRLAAFSPERLADPAVRALMEKIELSVDADIDRAFPGQRAARVTIQTRDGQVAEHFQPTRKGDPDAPLSDQDLSEKFTELTQPVLGEAASQKLLAALWRLEQCADVLTL